MAWSAPVSPVAGTVITVAYATANIVNPITWLRLMTGNADPPGTDYVVGSDSTTGTSWKKVKHDMIAPTEQASVGEVKRWSLTAVLIPVGYSHRTATQGRFPVNIDGATFASPGQAGGALAYNLDHLHLGGDHAHIAAGIPVNIGALTVNVNVNGTISGPNATDSVQAGGAHQVAETGPGVYTLTSASGTGATVAANPGGSTAAGSVNGGMTSAALTASVYPGVGFTVTIIPPYYADYEIVKTSQT